MKWMPAPSPSVPRHLLLAGAMLAVLSGCSVLGSGQRDPVTIYSPEIAVRADPGWPQVQWQLAIARPTATRLVDSPRIGVRPVPGELQVYRGAAWAQPPTDQLEGGLLRVLEDSGKIAAVGRLSTGLRSDYRLSMDIRRYEADYAGGALPSAVIEVSAKLLDSRDQRIVASRTFSRAIPAGTTSAASVADAFGQALGAITGEIAGWTLLEGQADAQAHPRP